MDEYKKIMLEIKNKQYRPIYFLTGDEPYFIDKITDSLLNSVLSPDEQSFNQTIIYGNDGVSIDSIIDSARQYPMMSSYQLIVVKEAQMLSSIDNLIYYVTKPLSSTILVFNYKNKSIGQKRKLLKALKDSNAYIEFKKLYDNKVPSWIIDYTKSRGFSIDINAANLLSEYLGNDLSKITKEIDKLQVATNGKVSKIDNKIIEQYIGISKDYNSFELQKAIFEKDVLKANKIIKVFSNNIKKNPIQLTIGLLYASFSKLMVYYYLPDKSVAPRELGVSPYFIKDYQRAAQKYTARKVVQIISILREFDMKSKGYMSNNVPQEELYKEMIFRIMH